jgi:hypothetical protein
MVKLLMIMQHITLYTPCIVFILVSHTWIFVIDRVEPSEPTPIEDANAEQDQDKPQCI